MFSKNIIKQINPRAIFFSLLLSIVAIILLFYFFAKGVNLEINPSEISSIAEVRIEEGFGLKFNKRLIFFPGKKTISLKAPGYIEKKTTFEIAGSSQTIQIQMEEIPGKVIFNISPEVNPQIYINNLPMSLSSENNLELTSGTYLLLIEDKNFLPLETEIEIEGFGAKQVYNFSLKPKTSLLNFKSNPIGADVFLDEKLIGKTPFSADVQSGTHQITFRLKGYEESIILEKVGINEDRIIDIANLTLLPGKLIINSKPGKSTILLDGKYYGLTPLEVPIKADKDHEVSIIKEGFNNFTNTYNLSSQETKELSINLSPIFGEVLIDSVPKSQIFLDGEFLSETPYVGEISSVSHEISFIKKGYRTKKVNLTPINSIKNRVLVELITEEDARFNEAPKEYVSSNDSTFILVKPGKITMGAKRNEPGQRANEVIRNISLTKPFFISSNLITNSQYKKFKPRDSNGKILSTDKKPVVNISWVNAALYCNWLSKQENFDPFYEIIDNKLVSINYKSNGYRLPTEAEWVWVSRSDNGKMLKFPWGDKMPVKEKSGNYAGESSRIYLNQYIPDYDDSYARLSPIQSFKSNNNGLYDLGGNAKEWVHDYYSIGYGKSSSIEIDPMGPISGSSHVIRGSSWKSSSLTELRLSYRDVLSESDDDVGFRIARWLVGKNEE